MDKYFIFYIKSQCIFNCFVIWALYKTWKDEEKFRKETVDIFKILKKIISEK